MVLGIALRDVQPMDPALANNFDTQSGITTRGTKGGYLERRTGPWTRRLRVAAVALKLVASMCSAARAASIYTRSLGTSKALRRCMPSTFHTATVSSTLSLAAVNTVACTFTRCRETGRELKAPLTHNYALHKIDDVYMTTSKPGIVSGGSYNDNGKDRCTHQVTEKGSSRRRGRKWSGGEKMINGGKVEG